MTRKFRDMPGNVFWAFMAGHAAAMRNSWIDRARTATSETTRCVRAKNARYWNRQMLKYLRDARQS